MESVAVITGGNSGIGFAVAQRLLSEGVRGGGGGGGVRVCLACRNMEKAASARQSLLESYPGSQVDILHIDVSSVSSVRKAAAELQRKYQHVDWLFFNAGVMPVTGIQWRAFWPPTPSNLHHMFSTGGRVLGWSDGETSEGLKEVFATNLFGHFLLLRHLEDYLSSQGRPCHVIWTSSVTAGKAEFNPADIQGNKTSDPYAHSKKAVDLLSQEINNRLNHKGIYSSTACPGVVTSQLTFNLMPWMCWYILSAVFFLLRVCLPSMTLSPKTGAEALLWLSRQDPSSLDHSVKYLSRATILGRRYVAREQIKGSLELTAQVWDELEKESQNFGDMS